MSGCNSYVVLNNSQNRCQKIPTSCKNVWLISKRNGCCSVKENGVILDKFTKLRTASLVTALSGVFQQASSKKKRRIYPSSSVFINHHPHLSIVGAIHTWRLRHFCTLSTPIAVRLWEILFLLGWLSEQVWMLLINYGVAFWCFCTSSPHCGKLSKIGNPLP